MLSMKTQVRKKMHIGSRVGVKGIKKERKGKEKEGFSLVFKLFKDGGIQGFKN